jgi:hypothetical protein
LDLKAVQNFVDDILQVFVATPNALDEELLAK